MPPITRPLPPRNPNHPTPLLRLKIQDLSHPGAERFLTNVPPASILQSAVTHVLSTLYPGSTGWLPTRSVTLILEAFSGVAYTTGKSLDDDHKEIHFSTDYITSISTSPETPDRVADEIWGVVVHEMVHCWQHNAKGSCPGGLIEGIADWVRLKAGYAPPHWKRDVEGSWDRGYQNTAYFLEWLERKGGRKAVPRINDALKGAEYDEDGLWRGLFGSTVEKLWADYVQWVKNDQNTGEQVNTDEPSKMDGKVDVRENNIAGDGARA